MMITNKRNLCAGIFTASDGICAIILRSRDPHGFPIAHEAVEAKERALDWLLVDVFLDLGLEIRSLLSINIGW